MRSATLWSVLFSAVLVLGGCNALEPRYPAHMVVFDGDLMGEWELLAKSGSRDADPFRFSVRERSVDVADGRINPEIGSGSKEEVRAYQIECWRDEPPTRYRFHGYLIEDTGQTFLGIQIDPAKLKDAAPYPFLLPLHLIFRLDKDGERVLIRMPDAPMVAWVPLAGGWLDSEPVMNGPAPEGEKTSLILTNSIDRALEVYRQRAAREDLWKDDPGVLVRPATDAERAGEGR